jgi:hypothetical protein
MSRSFQLTPGPKPATTYIIEASADNLGPWATTDTIDASALVDLLDGTYRLDAPLSPPDQYVRIIPTDGTLYGAPNRTYPPHPTEPGVFSIRANTVDAGMGVVAGVSFTAQAKTQAPVGTKTIVTRKVVRSNAEGDAVLDIPADAGLYVITLDKTSKRLQTEGLSGQALFWTDIP